METDQDREVHDLPYWEVRTGLGLVTARAEGRKREDDSRGEPTREGKPAIHEAGLPRMRSAA